MNDLPLQVGQLHVIEIHQHQMTDAGSGEIHGHRRAESPQTDDQYPCLAKSRLTGLADVRQEEMPTVAL